jgi:hypothetical protein
VWNPEGGDSGGDSGGDWTLSEIDSDWANRVGDNRSSNDWRVVDDRCWRVVDDCCWRRGHITRCELTMDEDEMEVNRDEK